MIVNQPINDEIIRLEHIELPKGFTGSGKLMARAAIEKGLEVEVVSPKVFIIKSTEKSEVFTQQIGSSTSYVGAAISANKDLAKRFMRRSGVRVPEGIMFNVNKKRDRDRAVKFMKSYGDKPLVLKPLNGNQGTNVFLDITGIDDMLRKCDIISQNFSRAVLEEQVQGIECRYYVVGDQVRGVILRKAANVVGDGKNTIQELVEIKNEGRKNRYGLKEIKIDSESRSLLEEQGMSVGTVPEAGQHIKLKRVSNLHQGGDSIDITDDVHQDIKDIAVAALKSMPTMTYAGIDILAKDHFSSASGQDVCVLEVNSRPMASMHHAPAYGKARNVCGDVIDYLFFDK